MVNGRARAYHVIARVLPGGVGRGAFKHLGPDAHARVGVPVVVVERRRAVGHVGHQVLDLQSKYMTIDACCQTHAHVAG